MEKKKVIKSIENLPPEVLELIMQKYPEGYTNHVFKVNLPNNTFFHAITVDMDDVSYLVKIPVKIDKPPANDFELLPIDEEPSAKDEELKEKEGDSEE